MDYAKFKLGAVEYPVVASPYVGALERLDPPIHAALHYYAAMIRKHVGAYYDALVTTVGRADMAGTIVAEHVGYDPLPYMTATAYRMPLLALYRTEETIGERTVHWYECAGTWTLMYMLPPLDASQAAHITHVLKAIRAVIVDRTNQGYDPDHMGGALVWRQSGVAAIRVRTVRYGGVPALDTRLRFPAIEMTLEVREQEGATPGLDTLSGMDAALDISNGDASQDIEAVGVQWEVV
jgi:hypothetical protein